MSKFRTNIIFDSNYFELLLVLGVVKVDYFDFSCKFFDKIA